MPISTVQSMTLTRKGRFVRISLNDSGHSIFRMTPDEVRCRDIRVGDTVAYSLNVARFDCAPLLSRRPPDAVEFSA